MYVCLFTQEMRGKVIRSSYQAVQKPSHKTSNITYMSFRCSLSLALSLSVFRSFVYCSLYVCVCVCVFLWSVSFSMFV